MSPGRHSDPVHAVLIYEHHAEETGRDSQQQPEPQSEGQRHNLHPYPADEGRAHAHPIYRGDTSEMQAARCLLWHSQLQPLAEVSGCECRHSDESPFLIKLIQKCSCRSDAHIDIHGC